MYQVESTTTFSGRTFLARWVISNLLAGLGCSAAGALLASPLIRTINAAMGWNESFEDFGGILLVMLLIVVVTGLVLGYAQRKALELHRSPAGRWMLATGLAVPVAALSSMVVGVRAGALPGLLLPGLVVGVAQMLVLQRHTPLAGWWILASALAVGGALLVVSALVAPVLEGAVVSQDFLLVGAGVIAAWAFYALASGLALIWLLGRR